MDEAHGLGPGRQQEPIEGNGFAAGERDFVCADVNCGDGRVEAKIDGIVGIEALVAQRQPFFRRAAGEIVLRQVRPVDRRRVVAAQHDDAALVFLPAQHLGRGESRRAPADDHNLLWLIWLVPLCARLPLRLSALLAHDDLSVALFDRPRIDRTERWRAQGLASAKIEAGVMPWTPNRVADNEPLRQRAVIVGALSADSEHVCAAAHKQHRFISHVADQLAAIRKFGGGDSERQIGTGWLRLIFSHFVLPNLCFTSVIHGARGLLTSNIK